LHGLIVPQLLHALGGKFVKDYREERLDLSQCLWVFGTEEENGLV
jgi:hypothetical protein